VEVKVIEAAASVRSEMADAKEAAYDERMAWCGRDKPVRSSWLGLPLRWSPTDSLHPSVGIPAGHREEELSPTKRGHAFRSEMTKTVPVPFGSPASVLSLAQISPPYLLTSASTIDIPRPVPCDEA
jgi:hypothetical protein